MLQKQPAAINDRIQLFQLTFRVIFDPHTGSHRLTHSHTQTGELDFRCVDNTALK